MIQYSTPFLKRWRQTLSIPIVFGAFLALILSFMIPSTWRENSVSAQPSGQFNGGSNIREKVRAPEFDGGVGWLNVERPLRLTDLRSKIVLLDFWTYCCINCMHIIPDLKKLEKKYEKELVVIGVHSAKFLNEKETENIRNAILRYEIEHPVVNDANFKIWQAYGARGWPHLVLIDPEGYFVGETSGEGNYDLLDRTIKQLLQVYQGKINPQPIPLALEKNKEAPSILSFPGKILADSQGKRLFISDSNHNRIVITDMNGNVTDIAGIGTIGKKDGSFADAQFHHPQGMVLAENFLYVADTENHLLRRIDLSDRTVKTIAGTGVQALGRSKGGDALQTALNSPWDLHILNDSPQIYIAMAGPHQIWIYHPEKQLVMPYAGTGREDLEDGPVSHCALAQPSGLSSDGQNLFFADSEVSALRWVDRTQKTGIVKTLIGSGLFNFGDRDGNFSQALLQHPLGVQYQEGKVYIADTYNHKIKAADLKSQTIQTIYGNGKPGWGTPEAPQFNEPGGVSISGNQLYVADTNNHAIRVIDLQTRRVSSLNINLSDWEMKRNSKTFQIIGKPQIITLTDRKIPTQGSVEIALQLPPAYHLNPSILPLAQFKMASNGKEWIGEPFRPQLSGRVLHIPVPTGDLEAPERAEISVTYYYCREDNQGQCMIGSLWIQGSMQTSPQTVSLTVPFPPFSYQ